MSSIMTLIDDYLALSNKLALKLQKLVGSENLMGTWRNGSIPKSNHIQDVYYQFHGSGIYIESGYEKIEIDFIPHGQLGGFDAWRLWEMINLNLLSYPGITSEEDIREELEYLLSQKKIVPVSGTNLYMLAKN